MRLVFITLLALVIASAIGLGSTYMTATKGTDLGTLKIGAWTARPKTGTSDVDPYSRAIIVRSGELPVGSQLPARAREATRTSNWPSAPRITSWLVKP